MSWVKLDDGFPDHPKVIGLSVPARWGFVAGLCYCASYLTDGLIPERKARELAGRGVKELVACGLWEQVDKGYEVHDYLDYNPSRNEVTEHRQTVSEARSKAGIKGAAKRWQTDGNDMAPSRPVLPYPSPKEIKKPDDEEGNVSVPTRRNIFVLYDNYMGKMAVTPTMREVLIQAEEDYPDECITHCFLTAARSSDGRRSWKYVESILKRHQAEGCNERKPVGRNAAPAHAPLDSAAALAAAYPSIQYWPEHLGPDGGGADAGLAPVDGGNDPPRLEVRR